MALALRGPDGQTMTVDEGTRMMMSPEFRFAGMNRDNWGHFSAGEIQRMQMQRDAARAPRMNASEQVAVQDAFRQMVGLSALSNKQLSNYQRAQAQRMAANPLIDYAHGVNRVLAGAGTDVMSTIAPKTAAGLQRNVGYTYGEQAQGFAGKAGEFFGSTALSVPAVMGGPLGTAAIAGFGVRGFGSGRAQAQAAREAGRDVSAWQEYSGALATGAMEVLSEYATMKMARVAGGIIGDHLPQLAKLFQSGGRTALREGVVKLMRLTGTSAFQGGQEAITEMAENVIAAGTVGGVGGWNPEQPVTRGAGSAFVGGALANVVLGPIANRYGGAGRQQQASAIGEVTPKITAATQAGAADAIQASMESMASDPNIPDAAKIEVLKKLQEAEAQGIDVQPDALDKLIAAVVQQPPTAPAEATGVVQEVQQAIDAAQEQQPQNAEIAPETPPITEMAPVVPPAPVAQAEQVSPQEQAPARARPAGTMAERARTRKVVAKASQYRQEARTDTLTGVGNRRAYNEAKANIQRRAESTGKSGSVIVFDAANLRAANEKGGHAMGDALLKRIGGLLRKEAGRSADTVVARHGGDEFAVFLPDTNQAGAKVVRDRIEQSVGRQKIAEGVSTFVSGETATYVPGRGQDMNVLIDEADQRMAERKTAAKEALGEVTTRKEALASVGEPVHRAPARAQREGERGSPHAEKVFNSALHNELSSLDERDLSDLRRMRTREGQAAAVADAVGGDLDIALELTAANMGDIRTRARRAMARMENAGRASEMTLDELTSEGANMYLAAIRGQKSLTTTGKVSRAGDISQWDSTKGSLSTFLLGGKKIGPVGQRIEDMATGHRAGQAAREKARITREIKPELTEAIGTKEDQARRREETIVIEPKGLSQEGQAITAKAKGMLADGKTTEEVQAYIKAEASKAKAQGIDFIPSGQSVLDMSVGGHTDLSVLRDVAAAAKKSGRSAWVVDPQTETDVAASSLAKARGLDVAFVAMDEFRGARIGTTVLVAPGSARHLVQETIVHEITHATDLDVKLKGLTKSDEAAISEAGNRYLDKAAIAWGKDSQRYRQLASNPANVRREAIAQLTGEILGRTDANFDKIKNSNPGLMHKIVAQIRIAIKKLLGHDTLTDRLLYEFNYGVSAPITGVAETAKGTMDYIPPSMEGDPKQFYKDIAAVQKETPKQTGKPGLANPLTTETGRRIMDYLDERRKAAGNPARRKDRQVLREATTLLADKAATAKLRESIMDGGTLNDTETLAARGVLQEQADKTMKHQNMTNMLEMQKLGTGYRDGRTSTARSLRMGFDRIKQPEARIKEFVTSGLSELPDQIAKRIQATTAEGKSAESQRLREEYGARSLEVLAEWQKHGIDIENLTAEQAMDPRIYSKIMKDVQHLQYQTGVWDVVHEYRRNTLMYAPKTLMRNMLGGLHSVADVLITKPLARGLRRIAGVEKTSGETAAALHAWVSPMAVGRALGNAVNTVIYEIPQLETQIKLGTGKSTRGVAQTEIYSPTAITGRSLGRIVERATEVLTHVYPGVSPEAAGRVARKIGSVAGRAVRMPQAINAAVDEFVKTMHIHSEIAAHSVRIGKRLGYTPGSERMVQFVNEQLADMQSASWQSAIDSGESWRVAFQSRAGRFEKAILDVTSKEWGTTGNMLRLLVPFRKTPIQLAGQALMHVPGVGAAEMAHRAIKAKRGGKKYTAEQASVHAAQQMIGILGLAMVWNLVDEEEDKTSIKITGTPSYSRKARRERVTKQQAEPYMSVRIGDKWYNYNYIEPFSQWLGTLASLATEMKRARKTGKPTEAAGRIYQRMAGMYSDQTYLRTAGDMAKIISDGDTYTANRLAVGFAGSWLPNILDTAMRDADPYIHERKLMGVKGERPSFARQVQREMFPTRSILPPPKVDFFGNDIEVPGQRKAPGSMFMVRLLSPIMQRQTLTGKQADVIKMLSNWNASRAMDDPQVQWFQEPGHKVSVRYRNQPTPVREDMNEKEYYLYAKVAGLEASRNIQRYDWNVEHPTYRDITRLKEVFTLSRDAAREFVANARQAKANNRMEQYTKIIHDLGRRIKVLQQKDAE